MLSSTNESDIQFQLHFLDCQPDSVIQSLNDKSVMDHLYRAATNNILKFDKSYQRKESSRVTDLDQLNPVLFIPQNLTRHVSIDIIKTENRKISMPKIKTQSPPPPIEVKTVTQGFVPPAPPLPPSLDLAIKLQSLKTAIASPDQATLWATVRYYFYKRLLN
jgi:hypothetical protein